MKNRVTPDTCLPHQQVALRLALLMMLAMLGAMIPQAQVLAQSLTINVVDPQGNPIAGGFRWLVEEDATKDVDFTPALPGRDLSLSFHSSYMPVAGKGDEAAPSAALDDTKRYFVSVLPKNGYQMGGAPVKRGQTSVTVTVNPIPIPTAQISIFVFNDNHPINNAPDLPQETGLGGFTILLAEAGGGYGQSGGAVTQDAFGNPIGTEYDAAGNVVSMGTGIITTGPDGVVLIKNLAPAKYGIQAVPPAGSDWQQTSTIEGTKTIDAWVKANEPSYFQEFGPPGHHVFIGFVQPTNDTDVLNGSATITGEVVNLHMSRPPDYAFYNGHPMPNCWVGLNELPAAGGQGIYAAPCNADSTFAIPNVPPGDYQLVVWDAYLDVIFATHNVHVPANQATVALQEVPVFNWFSRLESTVFFDNDGDGVRDPDELGMDNQLVNLRFRDGGIYQQFGTDHMGSVPFDEVFPFFNWLVAEVDFTRFKATGATIVVDAGGAIDPNDPLTYGGKLNPQFQSESGAYSRTETGQVLTQAIQGFLGQTSVIEWGKQVYAVGENGGISGIVQYATTRAEDDPRYAAADNWEPGIPRVQVNLYQDSNNDQEIDSINGNLTVELADVDNWPFGWRPDPENPDISTPKGPEDVDHDNDGIFDMGDAIQVVTTDSWDDNPPTNCQGDNSMPQLAANDCFDGLRNFNQIRPGVFDGGYAFNDIPAGTYIVEAVAPPGYEQVKEEDKNIDFGDEYIPAPLLVPVACANWDDVDGDGIRGRKVPDSLTLFPGIAAPYAGENRPQCDRKHVVLQDRQNAGASFFMFTEVPVAAHIVGMILNDLANEFDPNAPTFGEKQAPAFVPVSIRDWTGREISRIYSDEYGNFNALVPSTYSMNLPMPSGASPNMLTTCMNDPGPIVDDRVGSPTFGQQIIDPRFNRQYSQFCYTFQYMPGRTTYLDTPVVPVAAFAGPGQYPLDCEYPDGTPVIAYATGVNGPWVPQPTAAQPRAITIASAGQVEVPNPAYDGTAATPRTIMRDYGFGATPGTVTLNGKPLNVTAWSDAAITAEAFCETNNPNTCHSTGQLVVTRGDNSLPTQAGLTFTVGGDEPIRVAAGQSIQTAIDNAPDTGSPLILVEPGNYFEMVIMHKPVRLQGWGAHSTTISAIKAPAEKLANWRSKIATLLADNQFSLLPGQTLGINAPDNEPLLFGAEEGPGILVVGNANNRGNPNEFGSNRRARIDGFTITGADFGGGVLVSGYAPNMEISNNRIISNQGTYGGGIRVGHSTLLDGEEYTDAQNDGVLIHHNLVSQNGSSFGAGGGVALYTGADGYVVQENQVCGNFSMGEGGGIGHLGLSDNGTIAWNTIIFNQTFNQGLNVNGGGVFVGGAAPIAPAVLSPGSGSVLVNANLIQGNQAGAGDGGGLRAQFVNGQDVASSANNTNGWYALRVYNNMIVDNMAGLAGGGISLQDAAKVDIVHNTIANNDSTATAGAAFPANRPTESEAQPAGIVARAHSTDLANTFGNNNNVQPYKVFSNPLLANNIVWHNRSFYWRIDNTTSPATFGLLPDPTTPAYWDLAVLGAAATDCLSPSYSTLTALSDDDCTYAATNSTDDPLFMAEYVNGSPGQTILLPETTTTLITAAAVDEGGNFIDVRFGPLTLYTVTDPTTGAQGEPYGNYHLQATSPALSTGTASVLPNQATDPLRSDFDRQPRANNTAPDRGADEQ